MSKVHIVSSGETLSQIARKNGGNWYNPGYRQSLLAANPQIINPHQIRTGLRIVLPSNLTRKVSEIAVKQAKTIRSATQLYDARIDAYKCDPSLSGEKERLWRMLDSSPTFQGMGVAAFKTGGDLVVLRKGHGKKMAFATLAKPGTEEYRLRERAEVINSALISCTGFGLELFVLGASSIPTMGATTALGWAAFGASGVTCLSNLSSLFSETLNQKRNQYEEVLFLADAIQLLSATGYVFNSYKALNSMKNASKVDLIKILTGDFGRQRAKALSKEINTINHGIMSKKQYSSLLATKRVKKTYSRSVLQETAWRHVAIVLGGGLDFFGSGYSGSLSLVNYKLLFGVTGVDNK